MINSNSKTALIIGCNGTFGSAVGLQLLKQGWDVKGLVRHANKKPNWLSPADVVVGSCESLSDVRIAAQNVSLIVYGANPMYHQWHKKAQKMLEPTARIAEILGLHILFPGNVYGYNPQVTPVINEDSPQNPVTDKGEVRNAMEQRLKQAGINGATVTVIRAGDFIAKGADSSWINQMLSKGRRGWSLRTPSPEGHKHSYVWMPDLVANAIALLDIDKKGYNVWHEKGTVASHQDWLDALESLDIKVKDKTMPWWVLKVLGLFHPIFKEVVKMRYLWQQSLLLDGSKMQKALGKRYQNTSLVDISKAMTTPKQ